MEERGSERYKEKLSTLGGKLILLHVQKTGMSIGFSGIGNGDSSIYR